MGDLDKTYFVDKNNKFKSVNLTPEQIRHIRENPKNLTKEGAEFYLSAWKDKSRNHVMAVYYDTVLHGRSVDLGDGRVEMVKCVNFAKSGLVKVDESSKDGRRIYSRYVDGPDSGKPRMVESLESYKQRVRFQNAKEAAKKEIEA